MTTVTRIAVGRLSQTPRDQKAGARLAKRGILARVTAAWQAAVNSLAPVGYEDAAGFHYGEKDTS